MRINGRKLIPMLICKACPPGAPQKFQLLRRIWVSALIVSCKGI